MDSYMATRNENETKKNVNVRIVGRRVKLYRKPIHTGFDMDVGINHGHDLQGNIVSNF